MTNTEIYQYYQGVPKGTRAKTITHHFRTLDVTERKSFIQYLKNISASEYNKFEKMIRNQAIKDFWTNERKLIQNGQSTRAWTPEQIESIMNISTKDGFMKENGGRAFQINELGERIVDVNNKSSYY